MACESRPPAAAAVSAAAAAPSKCDSIFTGGLGSSATCGLLHLNVVSATLSSDSSTIPGSSLCLLSEKISSATHQSLHSIGCISILSPANPVQPHIVVSGTLAASACAPLVADLRASGWSAGRLMSFQWSLPLLGLGLSIIQPLLATSDARSGYLVLNAGVLSEGQSVNISVRVSNFLGASTLTSILFQRLSSETPSISVENSIITDPVTSSESLLLKAVLAQSPCIVTPLSLNLRWTYLGRGHDPLTGVDSTQSSVLLSLKNISPSAFLKFVLLVNSSAGSSPFAFDVVAPSRKLVAKVKTAYLQHSQNMPFSIDASLSGSSNGHTADLMYAWSCSPAPCFAIPVVASAIMSTSLPRITIPGGVMLPGSHVFVVTVSADGASASASSTVVTWLEERPSVALPGPYLKGFSSATKVAIEASVNTSMCIHPPSLQWSVVPELFSNGATLAASILSDLNSSAIVFAPKSLLAGCSYVLNLHVSCRCVDYSCNSSATTSFFVMQAIVPGFLLLSASTLTPFQILSINASRWSFDSSSSPVVYEAYIAYSGSSNLMFMGKSNYFLFNVRIPCLRAASSSQDASYVRVMARDYSGQSAFLDTPVLLRTCTPPTSPAAASAAISASVAAAVQLQSASQLIASLTSARALVLSSSSSRRLLVASNLELLVLENIASALLLLNSEPPSIVDSQVRLGLVNDAFVSLPSSFNVQKRAADAFAIIMSRSLPQPASAAILSITGEFLAAQLGFLNYSIGSQPNSELSGVFVRLNEGMGGFVASENRLMISYELAVTITTSTLLVRYVRLSQTQQFQAAISLCPSFSLCSSAIESPELHQAIGMFLLASSSAPWLNAPVANMSTVLHSRLVSATPAAIAYATNQSTTFSFSHPASLHTRCMKPDRAGCSKSLQRMASTPSKESRRKFPRDKPSRWRRRWRPALCCTCRQGRGCTLKLHRLSTLLKGSSCSLQTMKRR